MTNCIILSQFLELEQIDLIFFCFLPSSRLRAQHNPQHDLLLMTHMYTSAEHVNSCVHNIAIVVTQIRPYSYTGDGPFAYSAH